MRFATGFYSIVVSLMFIIVFSNLIFMKYGDGIKVYENVEMVKSVVSEPSYKMLVRSVEGFDAFIHHHFEVISPFVLSDYALSVYVRFYLVLNMVPLILCFVLVGFTEGKLSRNRKIVSFGTMSFHLFQYARRIMVLTVMACTIFYITYPFGNIRFDYLLFGVCFWVFFCVRTLCANFPQRV
jgi:hypothetical protein